MLLDTGAQNQLL